MAGAYLVASAAFVAAAEALSKLATSKKKCVLGGAGPTVLGGQAEFSLLVAFSTVSPIGVRVSVL